MYVYLSVLDVVLPEGSLWVWLFYSYTSQNLADSVTVSLLCFVIGQSGYGKSCNQHTERLTKHTRLTLAVVPEAPVNRVFFNF